MNDERTVYLFNLVLSEEVEPVPPLKFRARALAEAQPA
jgi:hypothetical protein